MPSRAVILVATGVILLAVTMAQAGAATLVGQWDFEGDPATTALQNKVSGIVWDIFEVPLPSYIEDGKLRCPVAYDELEETWGTGGVIAALTTDIPDFRQKTTVLWLWFDKLGDADDWIYPFRIESGLMPGDPYNPASAISWRSGWSTFNSTIRNNYGYAVNVFPFGLNNSGPVVQEGQLIKVAEVITEKGQDQLFTVTYYLDLLDGKGLRRYGSPVDVEEGFVCSYGDPAAGDFVEFMAGVANLTGDTAGVTFEEARVYDGVLTPCEIAALRYAGQPDVPAAPRLVGHWTFDEYAGTHVLADKVPDVDWTQMTLVGEGASVADGKLILPRYNDGTWKQTAATCMLRTDFCTTEYFKEMTQIAWLKWPGFDTAADWARLTGVIKCPTASYEAWNAKAGQGMVMKATDDAFNWGGHRAWEYLDGGMNTANAWLSCGGSDPPTNRFIKVALVLKQVDQTSYEQSMYWDTGSGLAQLGATATVAASQVNAFGQYDTNCLVDSSGGKRYDGFGIMDVALSIPQYAGQIEFDEVRLYAGALSPSEIGAIQPVHAPLGDMVGHWTFDNYLGTGPLESKVPSITWEPLTLTTGSGARTEDGKLVLPRYQEGAWKQSSAYTRLTTDLGAGGYFRQMTQVAWLKWPGFDATSIWSRLMGVVKSASAYNPGNQATVRGAQTIAVRSSDARKWVGHRVYEKDTSPFYVGGWFWNNGANPPTDRYIKIAQVVRYVDVTKYEQSMYWDLGDGSGLVETVSPAVIWTTTQPHWVEAFGQYGTDSIKYPGAGNRYDAYGFMDYSWQVPQSAGDIIFEEVRLYRGALTPQEIAGLRYIGQAEPPKPVIGTSGRSLADPLMESVDSKYQWVLWGIVTLIDDDSFSINDGSGVDVTVIAPGHGLAGGEYARVQGALDAGTTPKVLTATRISVSN